MGIDLNKKEEKVDARLEITNEMKENLMIATKWIKFMNTVGCIFLGALALFGIIGFFYGIIDGRNASLGIIYFVLAAIYYPVLKRVFSFVSQARCACKYDSCEDLDRMFDSLRFVSKYFGIICIVVLGIYALALIVGILTLIFR